uniref:Uncharacterized protein n=1 Tax=uncultured marine virus TaxID=186617 RepID=A0A0F7L4Q6_9VIRU|nr:hypothetical protein [uncultured marine virus]
MLRGHVELHEHVVHAFPAHIPSDLLPLLCKHLTQADQLQVDVRHALFVWSRDGEASVFALGDSRVAKAIKESTEGMFACSPDAKRLHPAHTGWIVIRRGGGEDLLYILGISSVHALDDTLRLAGSLEPGTGAVCFVPHDLTNGAVFHGHIELVQLAHQLASVARFARLEVVVGHKNNILIGILHVLHKADTRGIYLHVLEVVFTPRLNCRVIAGDDNDFATIASLHFQRSRHRGPGLARACAAAVQDSILAAVRQGGYENIRQELLVVHQICANRVFQLLGWLRQVLVESVNQETCVLGAFAHHALHILCADRRQLLVNRQAVVLAVNAARRFLWSAESARVILGRLRGWLDGIWDGNPKRLAVAAIPPWEVAVFRRSSNRIPNRRQVFVHAAWHVLFHESAPLLDRARAHLHHNHAHVHHAAKLLHVCAGLERGVLAVAGCALQRLLELRTCFDLVG